MSFCSGSRLDSLEVDEGAAFGDWQVWRRTRCDLRMLFIVHNKRKTAIELPESSSGFLNYFDEAGVAWAYYGAGRPQKWKGIHVPDSWRGNTAKLLAEEVSQVGNWRFEFPDGLLRITNTCRPYCVLLDRQRSTFVIRTESGDESLHPMCCQGSIRSVAKRPSLILGEQTDGESTPKRCQIEFAAIQDGQGAALAEWTVWRGRNHYGTCLQIIHRETGFIVEVSGSSSVMALYRDEGGKVWMVSGSGAPEQAFSVSEIVADPRRDPGVDLVPRNVLFGAWRCAFASLGVKLTSQMDGFTLQIDHRDSGFTFRSKSGFETRHPAQPLYWPTEKEVEEQRQLPRVDEETMSSSAFWDENDDLALAALRIRGLGFPEPGTMRAIPEAIMERAWKALDGDQWNEDAGYIIATVGRGIWDAGNVDGLLLLRRLYQEALRHNLKERPEVMYSLCEMPLKQFFRDAERAGFSDSQIESNPMTAVEKCYFGEGRDRETYLQASCVLMAYRDCFLSNQDAPECLPGMYALREAYALYYAGQIEAARQAVEWAMPLIDTLDPERNPDLSSCAGILLRASAMAAERAGDYDGSFDQVHDALRFLSTTGEHRAAAVCQVAEEFKRRGEAGEAIRWFGRVLETPGADAETLQLAKMELSALRAELEGKPSKVKVDPALMETYGIPAGFVEQLPEVLSRMLAGEKLSDESIRQLMGKLPEWIDYKRAQEQPEKAFSALIFMLKLALSLDDQTSLPVPYDAILQQADALAPAADAAAAVEYEQLRSVATDRIAKLAPRFPTPFALDIELQR